MALRCRKNQASLSDTERSRFVRAVLAMKASGAYEQFVQWHIISGSDAHGGPAFLPWHREFLRRFELGLQQVDPSVTLPYWDWSVDNSATSSIWNDDFMGGNGRPSDGVVTTGPFAFATGNWDLNVDGPQLRRRFGQSALAPTLPTPADVAAALAPSSHDVYDVPPWSFASSSGFRNRLEGWINGPQLHNRVHVWVGGSMVLPSSPNDPVFFLHHCFIDKLWADWQALHPGSPYLPINGAALGHNLNNPMQPWANMGTIVTPGSVVDHHALGYAYDTEAICRPTFKFIDDRPDFSKIFADGPIGRPTLKVLDDRPTLKVLDDGWQPTLKFRDDPQQPIKGIEDVSAGAGGWPSGPGAPFVLATPHHSMAWIPSFPEAAASAIAEAQSQIDQLSAVIQQQEESQRRGSLSPVDAVRLVDLRRQRDAMMAELRHLSEGHV